MYKIHRFIWVAGVFALLWGLLLLGCSGSKGESGFQMEWGTLEFNQDQPIKLTLTQGSGNNLFLSSQKDPRVGVAVKTGKNKYTSWYDKDRVIRYDENTVTFSGYLTDTSSASAQKQASYDITWKVNKVGYITMTVRLRAESPINGEVLYNIPFNAGLLSRYYYTSFYPKQVRQNTSMKHVPMVELKESGVTEHFTNAVIDRNIGFVNSETEALSFVVGQGALDELFILKEENQGYLKYLYKNPGKKEITVSFYILPSPVRLSNKMMRVYTAQHRGVKKMGVEPFIDRMVEEGFRYFIYHEEWQLQKEPDEIPPGDSNVLYGSHRPQDPEITKHLIEYAHSKGIKVVPYVGLVNEDSMTAWYLQHNGDKYTTGHPMAYKRKIMCMNTPYYEHLLNDTRYILDTLGADGVYIDWYTFLSCSQSHEYHKDTPKSNINKLIDYSQFVHDRGKLIFVHSGEEGRLPFLEDINDSFIMGERPWSRVDYQSTENGVFDRWSRSTGNIALISDVRFRDSDMENRLEINAALVEGLNPFGYVYRTETYDVLRPVTGKMKSYYVYDLVRQLKDYDVENMRYVSSHGQLANSDNEKIQVSGLYDNQHIILFVVNTDLETEATGYVRIDAALFPELSDQGYTISSKNEKIKFLDAETLKRQGFEVRIQPNTTEIFHLYTE